MLSINSVPVGGVLDVSAAHASDATQAFTFTGTFGSTPQISLSFINDASDGTPGHDRNLYLDGFAYDGSAQLGVKQALLWDQTATCTLAAAAPSVERASTFLDAMGVNVHLNYLDTSYGDPAKVAAAASYLGVTRLRIGLADITLYLPQLQTFAARGVKFDVLMPSVETAATLATDVAKLDTIAPSIAAIEGANEINLANTFLWNGQGGYAAGAAYQKALYADVKADPKLASASVYALTLGGVGADGYAALGNISASATAGNMHVYYGNGTAPYSTIQYNLGLAAIAEPSLPAVITETNYTNDPSIGGSVSSDVQAKYDLDIFMDAAKAGVQSTTIYELLDEFADPANVNNEDHYGLFNVDGTPKPAATAIHNLRAVLADPGATAGTFTPGKLAYSVTGQGASGDTLLMEKSSGTYDLTIWAEPQIWNAATAAEVAAQPRQVQVALGQLASSVSVYDPMAGTAPIAQYSNTSQVTVSVTDHPLVIEINTAPTTLLGGAGLMTVLGGSKEVITGGSGGLTYNAGGSGGGNTITTAAGATDVLTLAGADTVASYGHDTISGGSGNQAITVHGNAKVTGSTGNSVTSLYGHDTLIDVGQDYVTVNAGAQAMITAGAFTTVAMTNAWTVLSAGSGAAASKVSVAGSAVMSAGTGLGTSVATTAGKATSITSYRGVVTETLNGADTLHTGSGTDTVVIDAANTVTWGGSGALTVHNPYGNAGDLATVHGGSGTLRYDQGGTALRFIGGSGTATLDGGWGSLSVVGGAGALTVANGGGGLQFTAGSGRASIAMTPGGGDVTFGAGATTVQVASYGAAAVFHAVAGQGGGTDTVTGFRIGTDRLVLSGVGVASETTSGGSTSLVLSDKTHLQLVGVGDPSRLFG